MTPTPLAVYTLLGVCSLVIGVCKVIEWANDWLKPALTRAP